MAWHGAVEAAAEQKVRPTFLQAQAWRICEVHAPLQSVCCQAAAVPWQISHLLLLTGGA